MVSLKNNYWLILILAIGVLIVSLLASITFGPVDITIKNVYTVIFQKITGADMNVRKSVYDIVWLIRLPRVLTALTIGVGLSVSGCVMQAVVKNPLADPYVLGISSGATLGATLAIMLGLNAILGFNGVGFFAFLGALGISLLVQLIANIGGRTSTVKLLLVGMALSAMCAAVSSLVIYIVNDKAAAGAITFWLMGSLAGAKWSVVLFIMPIVLSVSLFFITQSRILNLMLLGDDTAITLGINLNAYRHFYLILSALIVGLCVYSSGMIGFVGLLIPHATRMIFGTSHVRLLPMAAVLGAIFIIWIDVFCRIILKNGELPLGILISIIGTLLFVYLMVTKKYGFGEN